MKSLSLNCVPEKVQKAAESINDLLFLQLEQGLTPEDLSRALLIAALSWDFERLALPASVPFDGTYPNHDDRRA